MSSHAAHGHGTGKKILRVIGITLRLILDVIVTAILFYFLWKAGMDQKVFQTGYEWTTKAMAEGFVNVLLPLWHLNFLGALLAVVDNLVSWETFTFVMDTLVVAFVTFCAYVLWRSWWLGGTILLLGLLSLAWFTAMWALQLFGPLLIPLIISIGIVGAVASGGWWLVKKVWSWAENTDEDH